MNATRAKVVGRMVAVVVVPAIPVLVWWKSASNQRAAVEEENRTKVRVPNVQGVDDLLVEKCQPGDVLIFDRRCEACAAGPTAALACLAGRQILCNDSDPMQTRSVETGKFDHCGIVVPGFHTNKSDMFDPSNLLLLEATALGGVVARPLLTRLERTQSRSVILLPLHIPGNDRNADEDFEPPEKTAKLQAYMDKQLTEYRDKWIGYSEKQRYAGAHASLGLFGALGYAMGLSDVLPAPVSPSAWIVVSALQTCGVGENLSLRTAMEAKVEDFLRNPLFHDARDSIRLRPGFKFLPPVVLREMSRS